MNTIKNVNFEGERVIIRVDYNVPLDNKNKVTDTTRIEASKETILTVLKKGGSVILLTHIGRPKGVDANFSCSLIVDEVSRILKQKVLFCSSTIGEKAELMTKSLRSGEVVLMENIRFHPEETKGEIRSINPNLKAKLLKSKSTILIKNKNTPIKRNEPLQTVVPRAANLNLSVLVSFMLCL
jgi:3-phosphoglycerate kinase